MNTDQFLSKLTDKQAKDKQSADFSFVLAPLFWRTLSPSRGAEPRKREKRKAGGVGKLESAGLGKEKREELARFLEERRRQLTGRRFGTSLLFERSGGRRRDKCRREERERVLVR